MSDYSFRLPDILLNVEQVLFIRDTWVKSVAVESAEFGDLTALEDFRAHAARIDEVFGPGAVEASVDINGSGWGHYVEGTRQALLMIHDIVEMREAKSFGAFSEAQKHLDFKIEEYVIDYYIMYEIEN